MIKLYACLFLMVSINCLGQNFSGQWKGHFVDNSHSSFDWGGNSCEYVLELDVKGKTVSGHSYTYFTDNGRRYYTICKVKGTINPQIKYVEVVEYQRIKSNLPDNIQNCFQVHRLNFSDDGNDAELVGNWKTAPGQTGNCGFGKTELTRRNVRSLYPGFNAKKEEPKNSVAIASVPKKPIQTKTSRDNKTIASIAGKPKPNDAISIAKANKMETKESLVEIKEIKPAEQQKTVYEDRAIHIINTYRLNNRNISIQFVDNGVIDGDSISVFLNNSPILEKHLLTDKPITLNLSLKSGYNEIEMYALSLGFAPPNTALVTIIDGDRRKEIAVSSDLKKSGTIKLLVP